MKFSLSTNWCSDRIESAAEIAEKALSLGFDELELGFRINSSQAEDFRRISRDVAIGSVHAFCPVPISAPSAHPELYSLAALDENAASIARFHVIRSVEFASSVGADVVVLHAGRVPCEGFFRRKSLSKRRRGGEKVLAALVEMLPEADIFTHAFGMGMREKVRGRRYEGEGLSWQGHRVTESFIARLPLG
jgi:sugar phosphate isomerase/epimerase